MTKVLRVAVVGKPNSGKSTLINYIMGDKLCIVSERPHSTRENVLAIYNDETYQLVFTDTPGINDSKRKVFRSLSSKAINSLKDCDISLFLIDATKSLPGYLMDLADHNSVAVITKVDIINHNKLLPLTAQLSERFTHIFSISNQSKDVNKVNYLIDFLKTKATEQPRMFPEEFVTNKSTLNLLQDRIQEVLFSTYAKEIPYQIQTQLDYELKEGEYHIYICLRICRSYKPIILGKIAYLGPQIRKALKEYLNTNVHSFIEVKLMKK